MKNCDILVIGAGATGLMAACALVKSGKKVTLLEARNRCGGRIHTLNHESSSQSVELGAEFIHGDLPVTLKLLKDAGIEYHPANLEMWRYKNGKFDNENVFTCDWNLLMDKLKRIEKDISINEFLAKEFPGEKYNEFKNSVIKFVSGYDTADPDKTSSFALRNEWLYEDENAQHRVKGGYGIMINYLEEEFKKAGGKLWLNTVVKEIHWQAGKVKVFTNEGKIYEAAQILIALPLGILQAGEGVEGTVNFYPQISEYSNAINKMGFGAIIKILLEFDAPFWGDELTEELVGTSLKDLGFLLSDEEIPAWWTQLPQHSPVLTGWLGRIPAAEKKNVPDDELLKQSLQSLSNIFKRSPEELKNKLVAHYIMNWTNEPFTHGSYAYDTIESSSARKVLSKPINNTVFFAGEYLYEGPAIGTVEAALASGEKIAKKMIDSLLSS